MDHGLESIIQGMTGMATLMVHGWTNTAVGGPGESTHCRVLPNEHLCQMLRQTARRTVRTKPTARLEQTIKQTALQVMMTSPF